jgi:integrase/recombinase XerD
MQHVVTILLETGRRISEVCTLPFHCLESDHQGDYFLKIEDQKLKKTYLLPISKACLQAIHEQQRQLRESHALKSLYLFPARRTKKSLHLSARYVNQALNELAEDIPILNDTGQIWHFHTHQFRHTVGTRMINAGVPQLIVQRYLGHESPEMTARYAHVG